MWHEARKQERKIRGLIVDYRRRAERRQDFYEKIKADPTQFMQIHGRKCKVHLDPAVAAAGESSAIMFCWQGQQDNMIDRFDGRAHLDFIPPVQKKEGESEEVSLEERQANYERYRILAQNEFLGISEEKYLQQLILEEQFGANAQMEMNKRPSQKPSSGAAIGYTYADSTEFTNVSGPSSVNTGNTDQENDSDLEELDVDVSINITKLDTTQANELNKFGWSYGMKSNDFYSFLTKDADEADALRMAKEEEQEKIMFSGRKSRRERRAQREKKFSKRFLSPPSYAAKEEALPGATNEDSDEKNDSEGESRSPSPLNSGKITYITSFGEEEEPLPLPPLPPKPETKYSKLNINYSGNTLYSALAEKRAMTYSEKVKSNLERLKENTESSSAQGSSGAAIIVGKPIRYRRGNRSRSRSRDRYRRSRSSSRYRRRSRSRSRDRSKRRRSFSSKSSRSSSSSSSSSSDNNRKRRRQRSQTRRSRRYSSSSSSSVPSRSSKSSKKKTPSPVKTSISVPIVKDPTPEKEVLPIKRYYGRKKEGEKRSSDSELSFSEGEEKSEQTSLDNQSPAPSNATEKSSSIKTGETKASSSYSSSYQSNLRDRLKRKMQTLLNKQYKADKKAEIEKSEKQIQMQQERNDEMRELALKLRKRQRELRHRTGSHAAQSSNSDSNLSDDDEEGRMKEAVEEERQIQSRLNKLLEMSRRDEEEHSRHSTSRRDYHRQGRSEQRRRSPDRRDEERKPRSRSQTRFNRSTSPRATRDDEYRRRYSPHRPSHRSNKKLVDY